MDVNIFILWMVFFSCLVIIIRVGNFSRQDNRGWLLISFTIIIISLISLYFIPQWSGLISLTFWLILILIPLLGFNKINQLVCQEKYQQARQLAQYLAYLHPADGWLEQPKFLTALALGQQGKIREAQAIINHYPLTTSFGRQAKSLLYFMEADWEGFLSWIEQEISEKLLFRDLNLLVCYLRALGEVGRLNSLLENLEKAEKILEKIGDPVRLNLIRMFALAFCGKTESVWQLFEGALKIYPSNTRSFWLATAQMARGNHKIAREELLRLQIVRGGFQDNAINWRLAHPPQDPNAILTANSQMIIAQIERNIQEENRYQNLNFSTQKVSHVTNFLIGINLVFFGLEMRFGGVENIQTLYKLGGLVPGEVIAGQWWRLITANFLHFGWLHLLTNMLGLYWLGAFVELNLGKVRYLIAYFLSGVGAMSLYTYLAIQQQEPDQLLIGASAAIMGLIGVIGAFFFQGWRKEKSRFAAKRLRSIILIILLQFSFDITMPQVSSLSHLLGVMVGFIVGNFLLLIKKRESRT